jgi:hypothetical protein
MSAMGYLKIFAIVVIIHETSYFADFFLVGQNFPHEKLHSTSLPHTIVLIIKRAFLALI